MYFSTACVKMDLNNPSIEIVHDDSNGLEYTNLQTSQQIISQYFDSIHMDKMDIQVLNLI